MNRAATGPRRTWPLDATVVLDGAVGSELERRRVPLDRVCWNALAALTHADVLTAIHTAHVAAGADVITTSTFATNRYVLAAAGHGEDFARVNRAAVAAAERARATVPSRAIAIAGSVSCLPPAFDTRNYPDQTTERAAYVELTETLAALGVDVLALEMMQDVTHASLCLEAAKATGLPVWLGVSCRVEPRTGELVGFDFPTTRFIDIVGALAALTPDAINIMHTPTTAVDAALEQLRSIWHGPVGVYPELGSFDPVSRTRSPTISPGSFARLALGWKARGATMLGGCCGASPAHIGALAAALERPRASEAPADP